MTARLSSLIAAFLIGLAAGPAASAPRSGSDWLQVESVGSGSDTVARVYREQLLAWYRNSGAMNTQELETLPQADYFAFRPDLTSFSIDQGDFAGQWTFAPPQQGRWPDTAVQVLDRSDAAHYRILTRVYCDPGTAACRRLREETARMPPPEPPTDIASPSYATWQTLVMSEACTPAPKTNAAPKYPPSLAAAGEGGRVVVRLLVNPCGEVRAVRLEESSGFAKLDQSTIDTAWRWRLYSERQKEGAIVKVPVDFVPPTYDGATTGRGDRAAR